jgi:hypothetical protein
MDVDFDWCCDAGNLAVGAFLGEGGRKSSSDPFIVEANPLDLLMAVT